MGQKPEAKFDKLFPKLYNIELWLLAYERLAPQPGNMTPGTDGKTIDGTGLARIQAVITELKASRYKPKPVRRVYIPKSNGQQRPIGVPSFEDKLLQMVVHLILTAIYEPTFSDASHGFRPQRSCHTALKAVKRMNGVRWWVEGDIRGFFDSLDQDRLLAILARRITDQRFLHLIQQLLRAGYVEDWQFHKTYSGTPQGGNLSPLLSNIYLNELDRAMETRIAEFNQGKRRRIRAEYKRLMERKHQARKKAEQTGDWTDYKRQTQEQLGMPASDPHDPNFRRLYYIRYADDFLVGVIGGRADAVAIKAWLADFLRTTLHLELSVEKTLITNARKRVRFLGYDIQRWSGKRRLKMRRGGRVHTQRTTTYQLALLLPHDKCVEFVKRYGNPQGWKGHHRANMLNMSELEILLTYNTELRGFLGYYALADNLTRMASKVLWMSTGSFLRTLAAKHNTTPMKIIRKLKQGPNRYVVKHEREDGTYREYRLVASTKQLRRDTIAYGDPDDIPHTWKFIGHTELGQRLRAGKCEWCGTEEPPFEVHHVRKLKDLKGKNSWEQQMIARQRKTMVLCRTCHVDLHAGRLTLATKHC
jgi:group II intron reverse transcriptase/maturase